MKSCSRTAHLERREQKERRSSAQGTFGLWWHFYFYYETATQHCFRSWFDSPHAYKYNTLTLKKCYWTPVVFKTIHLLLVDAEEHGSSQTQHSCDPYYKISYQKVMFMHSIHPVCRKTAFHKVQELIFLKCVLECIAMLWPKPQSNSQMKNRTWLWVRKGGKTFSPLNLTLYNTA